MDALFGLTGPDFVVVCADKMHARSIVKMDVRSRRPPPLPSPCCALASRNARPRLTNTPHFMATHMCTVTLAPSSARRRLELARPAPSGALGLRPVPPR